MTATKQQTGARPLRRRLATAAAASVLTVATPMVGATLAPTYAAEKCAVDDLTRAEQAKLPYVFTGTVTDVAESAKDGDVTRIITVEVDRWWAGDLDEQVRVTTPATAADCGLRGMRKGTDYVFFGREGAGNQVEALSFQGTAKVTKNTQRQVSQLMDTRAKRPKSADADAADDQLAPTVLDDSEPPRVAEAITVPAVVVVVGLLLFGLGALLGRRLTN